MNSLSHTFVTRKRTLLGALIVVLMLAFPLFVFADNVQNDVQIGGNDTITVGGSTSVSYRIVATNGDNQNGCNAADSSPATVTINAPAGVTVSPSTLSFTACGVWKPATFTSNTVGNYDITVSISDSGPGTYNLSPAKFTLKVNAPADSTPPVITPDIVGPLGNNGWYVGDVQVSWTVSDPESAITSSSGCGSATISADTSGTTLTCSATSTGGTKSESVTIKRDATAPDITYDGQSPAANANGWNNTDVTLSWDCADAGSGPVAATASETLSAEGAGQSATGTCSDNAGNSAASTDGNVNIDKTAPTNIQFLGGISNGASYFFNYVPAAPTCTADGAISGLASCNVSGYSAAIGSHTLVATATDLAGNVANGSNIAYTVKAWVLNGFLSPVDMSSSTIIYNTSKAGSTVPLKFEIFADSELTDLSAVQSLAVAKISCTTGTEDALPPLTAPGSTGLRYDTTAGQYIYNWKTPADKTCYKVTMTALDGSTLVAYFKLK